MIEMFNKCYEKQHRGAISISLRTNLDEMLLKYENSRNPVKKCLCCREHMLTRIRKINELKKVVAQQSHLKVSDLKNMESQKSGQIKTPSPMA